MKKVYVVICGMEGGYLPDSVEYFLTKSSALDFMKSEKDGIFKVRGNLKDGFYEIINTEKSINALSTIIGLTCTDLHSLGVESFEDLND